MFAGAAIGAGALTLGGAVAAQATDPQNPGTTVTIVGAVAVVLVAIIGVIGNYLSNRRTAPSPPGSDLDLLGIHDRQTVMEENLREWRHQQKSTATEVAVTTAYLADIRRRLDKIEERLWPPD